MAEVGLEPTPFGYEPNELPIALLCYIYTLLCKKNSLSSERNAHNNFNQVSFRLKASLPRITLAPPQRVERTLDGLIALKGACKPLRNKRG